jgi:hypothetical protein
MRMARAARAHGCAQSTEENIMAIQFSAAVRNAMGNAIEATVGTTAVLKIWSGSAPATCATANSGTELASMTLPSDWYGAFSAGAAVLTGTWQDTSANATGTAGHYRLYASDGTTCHEQGTVTATGGGGDLTLDNTSIASGQQVTITSFSKTIAGA